MNIALVNISIRPWMDKPLFPVGLSYVASALKRAGCGFDLIDIDHYRYTDRELEELLGRKSYDLVAFGTLVSAYKYAQKVARIARKTNPEAIIVAGNSVASSIPEHLLTHTEVDVAVKGEGDLTIVNLIRALEKNRSLKALGEVKGLMFCHDGKLVDTGFEEPIKDVDSIPFPDWELFDIEFYIGKQINEVCEPYPMPREKIRAFMVNTARGCPFRCTFCYHVFQYCRYRYRSAASIISEIATLQERYGVNYIHFLDELSFFSKKQVQAFVEELSRRGLKFYWTAISRGDLFTEKDLDLLRKLAQLGCLGFGYSLESADPDILKSMNKKMTVAQFKAQKKALDKAGIRSYTSLVIGCPQETLKTIKKTFDVCYELNIYPSAGYLLPQPGTPIFALARERGLADDLETFLHQMGDRQDLRFNLTQISDDVLQAEVTGHLQRIADKLGFDLPQEKLIKTFTSKLSLSDEELSTE